MKTTFNVIFSSLNYYTFLVSNERIKKKSKLIQLCYKFRQARYIYKPI